jgi:hypothetical protein
MCHDGLLKICLRECLRNLGQVRTNLITREAVEAVNFLRQF